MLRRTLSVRRLLTALCCAAALGAVLSSSDAKAEQAYGRQWGTSYNTQDWNRFYHYPYIYYPQNYYNQDYYRSSESLYYRYPPEMRIPVYNRQWHNEYPNDRRYHYGHHFELDTF